MYINVYVHDLFLNLSTDDEVIMGMIPWEVVKSTIPRFHWTVFEEILPGHIGISWL